MQINSNDDVKSAHKILLDLRKDIARLAKLSLNLSSTKNLSSPDENITLYDIHTALHKLVVSYLEVQKIISAHLPNS